MWSREKESLPVILKSEMEFLLETAAAIVSRISYAHSKDMIPADTLFIGPKWDYLPEVQTKMRRTHKEEMEKIRYQHLIHEREEAMMNTKKQGRISGEIKPQIGDLVLIRSEKKKNYDKNRIMEDIPSSQTLVIHTRNGVVVRPWSLTILISPKSIIGDGTLRTKKDGYKEKQ